MSWSKEGLYASVEAAQAAVDNDAHLPSEVKVYIVRGLSNVRTVGPVWIKGHGHVCDGPGSYEETSCTLTVKPMPFAEK